MPPGYHTHQGPQIQCSPSRPLTPTQQFSLLEKREQWAAAAAGQPSKQDLTRYNYYLTRGVAQQDLEPMADGQMSRFYTWLPPSLVNNPDFSALREGLEREILTDYNNSLRKTIVDYILMDSGEKRRLRISAIPQAFPRR